MSFAGRPRRRTRASRPSPGGPRRFSASIGSGMGSPPRLRRGRGQLRERRGAIVVVTATGSADIVIASRAPPCSGCARKVKYPGTLMAAIPAPGHRSLARDLPGRFGERLFERLASPGRRIAIVLRIWKRLHDDVVDVRRHRQRMRGDSGSRAAAPITTTGEPSKRARAGDSS